MGFLDPSIDRKEQDMEIIIAGVVIGAFVVFVLPAIISTLASTLAVVGALLMIGACIITVVLTVLILAGGG